MWLNITITYYCLPYNRSNDTCGIKIGKWDCRPTLSVMAAGHLSSLKLIIVFSAVLFLLTLYKDYLNMNMQQIKNCLICGSPFCVTIYKGYKLSERSCFSLTHIYSLCQSRMWNIHRCTPTRRLSLGDRAFLVTAARAWNSLPSTSLLQRCQHWKKKKRDEAPRGRAPKARGTRRQGGVPLPTGNGSGEGAVSAPSAEKFWSLKWLVLMHSGSYLLIIIIIIWFV